MGAIGTFLVNTWNAVVALAPAIFHAACQLTEQAAKVVTLP